MTEIEKSPEMQVIDESSNLSQVNRIAQSFLQLDSQKQANPPLEAGSD